MLLGEVLNDELYGLSLKDFLKNHSPYLSELLEKHFEFLLLHEKSSLEPLLETLLKEIKQFNLDSPEEEITKYLRKMKQISALLIGLYDLVVIQKNSPLPQEETIYGITKYISKFAFSLTELAFHYAFYTLAKKEKMPFPKDAWGIGTGLIIVAMGKMGAKELNYSSDIDFCVFFDAEITGIESYILQEAYIKMTQFAVKLLSNRTADGYVYRTDLRLRPDPASTKVAVSFLSAEHYYERSGQNWERAAWIKGNFICGDEKAWEKFQVMMRPFIWRKNLDYAAIQDIQSIKRQLHTHYRQADIKVAGHDIKIGRGGIREIELYCQTQQLIGGGRDLRLRRISTFSALSALVEKGWLSEKDAMLLRKAYAFYRRIEHRLQMVHDSQTHLIPIDETELKNIASFCGYANLDEFTKEVTTHLTTVVEISDRLFAEEEPLGSETGNLVFTGHDDDPATLESLRNMGFQRPENVTSIIRKWHFGSYRSMRSNRARELLTEFTPFLLTIISQTYDPDSAIIKIDDFLSKIASGASFFSYLMNNPALMDRMMVIMGSSSDLGDYLARYPETFDIMTEPDFYTLPQTIEDFKREFSYRASRNIPLDKVLNLLRRFNREQKFRIGACYLKSDISHNQISHVFSLLAEFCLSKTVYYVVKDYANRNNLEIEYILENISILALGSLGAREMNASSDLDLMIIYNNRDENQEMPPHYTKIGQRLISALTTHSEDGILYEVDMRLRPSGNSGPLVVSIERFKQYWDNDAQTWELLALQRARYVIGSDKFKQEVEEIIQKTLHRSFDNKALKEDIVSMREKLLQHRKAQTIWDIKLAKGGFFEINFLIGYLGLSHSFEFTNICHSSTEETMKNLFEKKLLSSKDYETISEAWLIFQNFLQLLTISKVPFERLEDLSNLSHFFKERLQKIFSLDDLEDLENKLIKIYEAVNGVYKERLF